MAGTHLGGRKTAITMKQRYGQNVHELIGRKGGKVSRGGGFGSDIVGTDGLSGRERAAIAGAKGGSLSKRGPGKVYSDYVVPEPVSFLRRMRVKLGL